MNDFYDSMNVQNVFIMALKGNKSALQVVYVLFLNANIWLFLLFLFVYVSICIYFMFYFVLFYHKNGYLF